jgi:hypothetical protein
MCSAAPATRSIKLFMNQPPPLPTDASKTATYKSTRGLAILSCSLPLMALALWLGAEWTSNLTGDVRRNTILFLGGLSIFSAGAGLASGIIGLCQLAGRGRKNLMSLAVTGTVLSGLLILGFLAAIMVPLFEKAKERAETNRRDLAKVNQASSDMQSEVRKQLSTGGTNRELAQKNIDKKIDEFEKSVQTAANDATGDRALAMRASTGYLERMKTLKHDLDGASAELTAAKVLVPAGITNKSQLQYRREVVQKFMKANDALKDFIVHGEDNYRAELVRRHASDRVTAETIRGYKKTADTVNPLVAQVRECDSRIAQAMLAIVDLEESDWGNWHTQPESGKIIFQSHESLEKYNALIRDIRTATADEKKAQTKVFAASQTAN